MATRVPDRSAEAADEVERAAVRAAELLRTAAGETTPAERRRAARLGRLLGDPGGRELLFALTDEVLRASDPARAMRRLRTLLEGGTPRSLGPLDRAGLRLAARVGPLAPHAVDRIVEQRVRQETRGVILPAADPGFARHVARRSAEGMDLNVNVLGEAILGDDEADARLDAVCARLRRTDVSCVSVKISALCANLDVLAFDHSLQRIKQRLRAVYRVATETVPPKFVYLDMEEYRDLELTVAAFRQILDEPQFLTLPAGLALQAYLPDSHGVLDDLIAWAVARRRRGGAWMKVRIVKGANLAMERTEAELGGWPQAPYCSKAEVDASYKAMLENALTAAVAGDLRVGVASHNLFDVAWALTRRDELGLDAQTVDIEMLEGMAPAQARAARAEAGSLLLYTPVVADDDYVAAIAYLSRRLDENAAPENFLRALFTLRPGSPAWQRERERFEHSVAARGLVSTAPRRNQDRRHDRLRIEAEAPFANEPDTDFTLAGNREWIAHHLAADTDVSRPPLVTTVEGVDEAVACANAAARTWARTTTSERRGALTRIAEVMAVNRGRTIAVMAAETGKTVREGDTEVSEAIDMARSAAVSTRVLDELAAGGVRAEPRGTVVVAAPWNFPYAIPANGVVGALAAGNSVILKPAPEAVATAAELVRHMREAGIPADVVQLLRTPDDDTGRHLVTHRAVDTVVLTGAYETARLFHSWKPDIRLIAETSGKNAIVVTGGADLDLAINDLVRSAFGHAGQKCSAASLAIIEAGVLDDSRLLTRLADAVRSLRVGPARDLATMMGPVVKPPDGKLLRALNTLDRGELWLVEPRPLDDTGTLWSPGVKLGVQPGSFFHRTECFGPVLGIMRARDLDEALELQNATEFGLTGGLQSLDPDEIEHWTEGVEVGNAYVNRHITGAIVRRQPFGGWKHSAVGPGAKTGGPNDILRFVRFAPARALDVAAAHFSGAEWWHTMFGTTHDETGLRAERNELRYRPVGGVVVRAGATTSEAELAVLRDAADVAGVTMSVAPANEPSRRTMQRLDRPGAWQLRALSPIDPELARACHDRNVAIDDTPVTGHGRVELGRWLREQAISRTLHRHGRVPGMTRIHIDTDFGGDPDDACALVMALGWDGAEIVGVTTNLERDGKRAGCAAYYLSLAGCSDIAIASGATASLSNDRRYESTWGDERYWPEPVEPVVAVGEAALGGLRASIDAGATIVAIGSFTNLARLEQRTPGALAGVPVVATAGWLESPSGSLPQWGAPFDFNVQCDPRAVEIVAATADLTLVTLPVSMTVQLRRGDLARLRTAGPCGALLARQSEAYAADAGMTVLAQQHPGLPADLVNFHWDPLTCAVALGWDGVTIEQRRLVMHTEGDVLRFEPSARGRTMRIVIAVDAQAFVEQFATCVESVGRRGSIPAIRPAESRERFP